MNRQVAKDAKKTLFPDRNQSSPKRATPGKPDDPQKLSALRAY